MKRLLILMMVSFISGCASHYVNVKPIAEEPGKPDVQKSFYLAWPNDGREKGFFTLNWQANEGSGREVVEIMQDYLKNKGWTVVVGNVPETQKQALESAEKNRTAFMIYPELNIWNDPSSGACYAYEERERRNADEADVNIFVYDMRSKKVLNSYEVNIYGCPHIVNGFPIGTYTPEGQFRHALEKWYEKQVCEKDIEETLE